MSTADNLEIQKLLQITNIPALQELKEITNNPVIQQLNHIQNSLPQFNSAFKDIESVNNTIKSIIPSELSELQRTISEQFSTFSSSKIEELQNEYEDELLPVVNSIANTDIESITDEELEAICAKLKEHITSFAQSASDKIKIAINTILQTLFDPKTPLQKRLNGLLGIIKDFLIALILKHHL